MSQIFQPGFHVDPTRVKLSAHWEAGGNEPLLVELLRNEGSAFLLSIGGRPPVWAWLHDLELVAQLFEWFSDWGVAHYDDRHGLLKVWSGRSWRSPARVSRRQGSELGRGIAC